MSEVAKIVLPTKKVDAIRVDPKKLVMYAPPKMGKTTVAAELPNSLIIDLENGSDFVSAMKVNANDLDELNAIAVAIEEAGKPYDFVVVDTITKLEEMVLPLALSLYKATPMGKNFKGTDVLTLPNGAGYLYLRKAFLKVIKRLESLAPNIVLIGHLKDKMINSNGKEVNAKDLDLTGKLKSIMCADADAVGYLHRSGNQTLLNFISSDEVLCGSRCDHLRGQEIVLAESNEKGEINVDWTKVYTQLP
jgi:hypothetical protein